MAKALHNAYGEMENELRRINYIQYVFHCDSDREICMEMIEKVRRQNVYPVSALRSVKAEVSIVYQEDPNVFCVNEDIGKHSSSIQSTHRLKPALSKNTLIVQVVEGCGSRMGSGRQCFHTVCLELRYVYNKLKPHHWNLVNMWNLHNHR